MTDIKYGLSLTEVEKSRAEHGINVLTPPKRDAWYIMLLDGFKDPLIVILLIAAAVSIALGFVKGEFTAYWYYCGYCFSCRYWFLEYLVCS